MRSERFDVVVVGGGAGGVAAGIAAARTGARTLLIERYGFLGGAATNALVLSYCGFFVQGEQARPAVGGIGRSVLDGLASLGLDVAPIRSKSGNWIVMFDGEALKVVLDDLVTSAGVTLWLHAMLVGVTRRGGEIESLRICDHQGEIEVRARAFVDASGEADLAARARVPSVFDASRDALAQVASFPLRIAGVPPDVSLSRPELTELAAKVNARLSGIRIREDGGVFMRLPHSGDLWWTAIDLETDGLSTTSLTSAEVRGRQIGWICVDTLKSFAGFERARLAATGPQIGVRETRRPQARAMLTEGDALAGRRRPDGVARAAWPMEVHEPPGRQVFVPIGGEGFMDVPQDALRAAEVDNLWLAGRAIGADRAAYGSTRVMGTAFATGQAAGVSAAAMLEGDSSVAAVRRVLQAQGAII